MQKFTPTGQLLKRWGGTGTAPGSFKTQVGIGCDPAGFVYVVDHHNFRVQKFDNDGVWVSMWGTKGYGPYQFESAHELACDRTGNIYICDYQESEGYIQKYTYQVRSATRPTAWGALKGRYRH